MWWKWLFSPSRVWYYSCDCLLLLRVLDLLLRVVIEWFWVICRLRFSHFVVSECYRIYIWCNDDFFLALIWTQQFLHRIITIKSYMVVIIARYLFLNALLKLLLELRTRMEGLLYTLLGKGYLHGRWLVVVAASFIQRNLLGLSFKWPPEVREGLFSVVLIRLYNLGLNCFLSVLNAFILEVSRCSKVIVLLPLNWCGVTLVKSDWTSRASTTAKLVELLTT